MLSDFVRDFVDDFLALPENNSLGPSTTGSAWDGFLLGFSSGADGLYAFFKKHIGDFHWMPAEAFALGSTKNGAAAADINSPGASVPPEELTVISIALCQTEQTKNANSRQTKWPAEAWARSRIFGQRCSNSLQRSLAKALVDQGYPAVCPALLPEAGERQSPAHGRASNWSERHVAYASGLGTFGLSGGLITERGQAVRLGSVVVRAQIPPTPRPYNDPFEYCLFFAHGSCGECADRCPVGSVSKHGRDKHACARHLQPATWEYVNREYGFDGYGCGLCQTGVPCESGIPAPPRGRAAR